MQQSTDYHLAFWSETEQLKTLWKWRITIYSPGDPHRTLKAEGKSRTRERALLAADRAMHMLLEGKRS